MNNKFLNKLVNISNIDTGLDFILENIDNLILSSNFLEIDHIFTDIIDYSIVLEDDYLVGILVSTCNNKEEFYSRETFYEYVRLLLISKHGRKESLHILIGLK